MVVFEGCNEVYITVDLDLYGQGAVHFVLALGFTQQINEDFCPTTFVLDVTQIA